MSGISKRPTRKRAAVTYTLSSDESENETTPKKKQKYFIAQFLIIYK